MRTNIKLLIVSGVIVFSFLVPLFYINNNFINYSKCADFPIFTRKPVYWGSMSVNTYIPNEGTVYTYKDNKLVDIAKYDNSKSDNANIFIGDIALKDGDIVTNFEKMKSCIDTKGKYKIN